MSHFTTPRTTPVHHYQGLLSSTSHVPSPPSVKSFKNGCNRIEAKVSYVISELIPDGCPQLDIGNVNGTEKNGLGAPGYILSVLVSGRFKSLWLCKIHSYYVILIVFRFLTIFK
ncbi:hypothetical protein TNIN_315801 [Trichonephila inaurata madagascariensis]|uniref:Uncharacterized protein n=1 Tax=Trichonephila inaurata madagascariensis TaxID=2747483 RepID=A0A8X7BQW8_9ARAC|nr:hypothetical protein TNIN_315801 [Trichonephila inaurata madagascariensis]